MDVKERGCESVFRVMLAHYTDEWWNDLKLESRSLDEKIIILKWMLKKGDVRACSELYWLTIRTSGGMI
jgi:hypothetical protein